MHRRSTAQLKSFECLLGKNVAVNCDKVLVMGQDAKSLWCLAMITTYAIQTKPWIFEVDLWKSFVNVDVQFLEGLRKYWIEQ